MLMHNIIILSAQQQVPLQRWWHTQNHRHAGVRCAAPAARLDRNIRMESLFRPTAQYSRI